MRRVVVLADRLRRRSLQKRSHGWRRKAAAREVTREDELRTQAEVCATGARRRGEEKCTRVGTRGPEDQFEGTVEIEILR